MIGSCDHVCWDAKRDLCVEGSVLRASRRRLCVRTRRGKRGIHGRGFLPRPVDDIGYRTCHRVAEPQQLSRIGRRYGRSLVCERQKSVFCPWS